MPNQSGVLLGPGNLAKAIAEPYTQKTYNVDDYCSYNGYVWKCSIDINSAEAWTEAHWTKVKVIDEFISRMPDVSGKADKTGTVLTTTLSRDRKSGTASGDGSIAFGYNATASGQYSQAVGTSTIASDDNAHAEGLATSATGKNSHAEGHGSTASGEASHAEGYGTASGNYSHAEGTGTIANGDSQHAGGKYNIADNSSLEIIGNGTYSSRSNARKLDSSGNEYLKGDLYVGCNADSTGGNKVLSTADIEDGVSSTATNKALSANRGKLLSEAIAKFTGYTTIAQNTDLNSYSATESAGVYRCNSGSTATTLSHCPTTQAFVMIILNTYQYLVDNDQVAYFRRYHNSAWDNWKSYDEAIANLILKSSTAISIPSSGSSVTKSLAGITADYELVRWNFSSSAENNPPVNLSWSTAAGTFTITNNGGTTSETIKPVFAKPTAKSAT